MVETVGRGWRDRFPLLLIHPAMDEEELVEELRSLL
jgi:hypothetical protein